jgi:GNAT superfamily N-acetyltransferase
MLNFRSDVLPPMDSIIALYCAAPLYRPVDDLDRMRRMYEGSNVILTTWDGDRLVAVLRGITDGAYTTYVADLAVHPDYQRSGIGRELLARVVAAYPETGVILQAAQTARDYYAHVGWQKIENGWQHPRPRWSLPNEYSERRLSGGR